MTANGMPTPIPIFAPLVRPLGFEVSVEVCECVVVVCVFVEVGLEVWVAPANALRSELCHQTAMPSPSTQYADVPVIVIVVVLGVFASVEYQMLLLRTGSM